MMRVADSPCQSFWWLLFVTVKVQRADCPLWLCRQVVVVAAFGFKFTNAKLEFSISMPIHVLVCPGYYGRMLNKTKYSSVPSLAFGDESISFIEQLHQRRNK
jgi:hypothetical protein